MLTRDPGAGVAKQNKQRKQKRWTTPRFDEECVGKPPLGGKEVEKIESKERELKKQQIARFDTDRRGNCDFMMVGLERETGVCPSFELHQRRKRDAIRMELAECVIGRLAGGEDYRNV